MTTKIETCNCSSCPGPTCTCGCQAPTQAVPCSCGEQCTCGEQCNCGPDCKCPIN